MDLTSFMKFTITLEGGKPAELDLSSAQLCPSLFSFKTGCETIVYDLYCAVHITHMTNSCTHKTSTSINSKNKSRNQIMKELTFFDIMPSAKQRPLAPHPQDVF